MIDFHRTVIQSFHLQPTLGRIFRLKQDTKIFLATAEWTFFPAKIRTWLFFSKDKFFETYFRALFLFWSSSLLFLLCCHKKCFDKNSAPPFQEMKIGERWKTSAENFSLEKDGCTFAEGECKTNSCIHTFPYRKKLLLAGTHVVCRLIKKSGWLQVKWKTLPGLATNNSDFCDRVNLYNTTLAILLLSDFLHCAYFRMSVITMWQVCKICVWHK